MPKVSVILDNYNYARFLPEAIDSVLAQSFSDFELIIVDDGSTKDDSVEMIKQYSAKDERIIPVFKSNGGQTSAFNEAFAHCKGEIIAFLDSDDYWYPDKLEKIVEKHKSYKLVQHYLSNNGSGIYRKVNEDIDWHTILTRYGYLYNHSVCSSLSFDRELIAPFFPLLDPQEMIYCADGILLMIALSLTEVGFVREELGFYRVHGNNGFIGKSDYGARAREILDRQHAYVNKQLKDKGYKEVPFDHYAYFRAILSGMLEDGRLSKKARVVLYGTESSGLYMTQVLKELGIPVVGYADSSVQKQGEVFLEKTIYAPEQLKQLEKEFDCILIASSAQEAIATTLQKNGFVEGESFYKLPI